MGNTGEGRKNMGREEHIGGLFLMRQKWKMKRKLSVICIALT